MLRSQDEILRRHTRATLAASLVGAFLGAAFFASRPLSAAGGIEGPAFPVALLLVGLPGAVPRIGVWIAQRAWLRRRFRRGRTPGRGEALGLFAAIDLALSVALGVLIGPVLVLAVFYYFVVALPLFLPWSALAALAMKDGEVEPAVDWAETSLADELGQESDGSRAA